MTRQQYTENRRKFNSLRNRSVSERLWEKIESRGPDDCWPWLGCATSRGYGKLKVGGTHRLAHRLVYEFATGKALGELNALHRCDNPRCCNPSHIFAGTQADNLADMRAKGRAGQFSEEARQRIRLGQIAWRDRKRQAAVA